MDLVLQRWVGAAQFAAVATILNEAMLRRPGFACQLPYWLGATGSRLSEQVLSDQMFSEQVLSDQVFSEQVLSDQVFSEQVLSDQVFSEQVLSHRLQADRATINASGHFASWSNGQISTVAVR